jgi:hypothetical protein
MRVPGIEPGSRPWQGRVMPLNYTRNKHIADELSERNYTNTFHLKYLQILSSFNRSLARI